MSRKLELGPELTLEPRCSDVGCWSLGHSIIRQSAFLLHSCFLETGSFRYAGLTVHYEYLKCRNGFSLALCCETITTIRTVNVIITLKSLFLLCDFSLWLLPLPTHRQPCSAFCYYKYFQGSFDRLFPQKWGWGLSEVPQRRSISDQTCPICTGCILRSAFKARRRNKPCNILCTFTV